MVIFTIPLFNLELKVNCAPPLPKYKNHTLSYILTIINEYYSTFSIFMLISIIFLPLKELSLAYLGGISSCNELP